MTAPLDLPRLSDPGRTARAALGRQQTRSAVDLLPGLVLRACRWRVDDEGTVLGQRLDALSDTYRPLTGEVVRRWSAELGVAAGPDQPSPAADPALADQVAERVAEMVRAGRATNDRPATLVTVERAVARRLAGTRELSGDRAGALWWRPRIRKPGRLDDGTLVTAAVVEAAVRDAHLLQRHESTPDYAVVVAELRALAGLPPVAEASTPEAPPPGTGWLRRIAQSNP